ncbi:hypothetical protein ACX93W_24845 [Paenibacillus sp. CAU 1782]
MRKYQQKQIHHLLITLQEATDEIKRQFLNKNYQTVITLLGDCQDAAIYIGEFIENLEGEDTRTVTLLTEYHESLYHIAMEIQTIDASFIKRLKNQLRLIDSNVRNEFKQNKIEVAFFPYKASMWDALESIWLAAKEDPQCDAYVVPIPYFDRLPNGKVGQMHYEGHQYPDYVPIVDWQTYKVEERRPDVSFIHNGYDDYNRITTVHQNYYSENLKEHTELLCYSPYFVTSNTIEKHSCTLQGVVYSDRVYVQSDKLRDEYIQAIQEFEMENHCVGRFGKVKEKIVSSGSPKFDKVINSNPDDFRIPDEWNKLIEKADGSRKKIVFYNTSIGPILSGNEKYIAKLRSVFSTFRNLDDVVLWWRPHPLSEAAYSTMRSFLFDEYVQLIKEYKTEGYGIYDDTADLHRALSLSSAFYGDGTSVMQMYQCMDKPVMIQNIEQTDLLSIGSLCESEDYLWFLTYQINGFFRLNKNTWDVKYIGSFVDEKQFDWMVYHAIHQSGNKLYFSPYSAGAIAIYDVTDSSFQYVDLPLPKGMKYNDQSKFSKIIECDGFLYFIPFYYPGIVKLNMTDNSTEIINNWVKPIQKICDPKLGYFCNGVYNEATSSLVLAFINANAVLEFDLKNNTTRLNTISNDTLGYMDIAQVNGEYWLLSANKAALISFNIETSSMIEYQINLDAIPADGYVQFQKLVHRDGFLYLVPAGTNCMVKFNLANQSFSYVNDFCPGNLQGDTSFESIQNGFYYMSSNASNKIYVTEKQSNKFTEYDLFNGSLRQESIVLKDNLESFKEFLFQNQGNGFSDANSCALMEHPYGASLEDLLDMITKPAPDPWLENLLDKQVKLRLAEISHPDGKAGVEIYENAKKAVLKS